jgi:cytochrome oxidase Cu insertion factor (SCO1/SenC/PrrC family)
MLIIPASLIIVLPYLGEGYPTEGRMVSGELFEEGSENDLEVVFFGYAGCSFICPKSLFVLGEVLDSLKIRYPQLKFGGYFVDINAETQIGRAHQYSGAFSEHIKGRNVNYEELEEFKQEFGLSILKEKGDTGEIFHTDHFFVLKREAEVWVIKKIIANQTRPQIIAEAIEQELAAKI